MSRISAMNSSIEPPATRVLSSALLVFHKMFTDIGADAVSAKSPGRSPKVLRSSATESRRRCTPARAATVKLEFGQHATLRLDSASNAIATAHIRWSYFKPARHFMTRMVLDSSLSSRCNPRESTASVSARC